MNTNLEIKYRAWDKESKQMVYGVERWYDTLGSFKNSKGVKVDNYELGFISCPSFGDLIDANIPLMQFIGLNDKNKK